MIHPSCTGGILRRATSPLPFTVLAATNGARAAGAGGRSSRRREMRRIALITRTGRVAAAAALLATLGACDLFEDVGNRIGVAEDGYSKVPFRVQEPIGRAAAPDPPPVVAGIGGGAAEVPQLAASAMPAGVNQEMVEEGAQLFGTVCSACHGAGGAGTAAAPALNDAEWINISGEFDEIVDLIHAGVPSPREFPGAMPPLGGGSFDDEQVRALAAYVYALSHAEGA